MGIENPDADVVDQLRSTEPTEDGEEPETAPEGLPSEADPADVAEQRIAVPDDDDYDR
jgi:hypothetical protein